MPAKDYCYNPACCGEGKQHKTKKMVKNYSNYLEFEQRAVRQNYNVQVQDILLIPEGQLTFTVNLSKTQKYNMTEEK